MRAQQGAEELARALEESRQEATVPDAFRARRQLAVAPSSFWTPPPRPPSVPEAYYCPITCDIMREPVMDREGHTFERAAIEQWIEAHHTCPTSRVPLELADLAPNRALRDAIEEFLAANPALRPEAHAPAPAL